MRNIDIDLVLLTFELLGWKDLNTINIATKFLMMDNG